MHFAVYVICQQMVVMPCYNTNFRQQYNCEHANPRLASLCFHASRRSKQVVRAVVTQGSHSRSCKAFQQAPCLFLSKTWLNGNHSPSPHFANSLTKAANITLCSYCFRISHRRSVSKI